jgi:ATP-dependent helicase YprA (DUF1998 family)
VARVSAPGEPVVRSPETVDELVRRGELHDQTAQFFRNPKGETVPLYQHQIEALALAGRRQSYVVTSGTGSGKSWTYFVPIVDQLLRQPNTGDRVAALVIYPMNALVNSQYQALKNLRQVYQELQVGSPISRQVK